MINVLLVNDKLSHDGVNPNSIAHLFGDWVAYIDKDVFNPIICTLTKPDPGGIYLEKKGIKVYYLGYGKYSFKTVKGLETIITNENIAIVHLHGYRGANFGRIAARNKEIKNIVHEHAVLPIQIHQFMMDLFLRSYTDLSIAVSQHVRKFLHRGRLVPAHKIQVMGNGINRDIFQLPSAEKKKELRSRYGVNDDTFIIGAVGRLRSEKGLEYLIRAVPHILNAHRNICVLIAGDGPDRKKYERLVNRLGIGSKVHLFGHINAIEDLHALFDIQVIPSLSEGFPLCLLEAMASGLPIVASYAGGMREIGIDKTNVLFSRVKDPLDIAQKILMLLNNKELARKIAEQAYQDSKQYSIQHNVKELQACYEKVLQT